MRCRRFFVCWLCCVVALCLLHPRFAKAEDMLQIEWWTQRHGLAPENDQTRLAQAVFARVLAVADSRSRQQPRLAVLQDTELLLAFCLPDGAVVLSVAALDHCLQGGGEAAEARLAFVLGHELGHLADDDYWQARTLGQLQRFGPEKDLSRLLSGETSQQLQRIELKADMRGFLYAAMAGFAVHHLQGIDAESFFASWTNRPEVRALAGDSHPDPATRVALVQSRLRLLEPIAVQFNWAVRLAAAGNYGAGAELLEAVRTAFDAREVLANLALCHLQLGTLGLSPPYRLDYWLPMVLDDASMAARALGPVRGGPGDGDALLPEDHFRKALQLAQQALERDSRHLPSRLTAAAACLRLGARGSKGELYQGLGLVEAGLQQHPESSRLQAMHALLQAAAIPERTAASIEALTALTQASPTRPWLHFALARLMENSGDDAAAMPHWDAMATQMDRLPPLVAGLVSGRTNAPFPMPAPATPCGSPWEALPTPGISTEEARAAHPSPDWQRIEAGGLVIHRLPAVLSFTTREGTVVMGAMGAEGEMPSTCAPRPGPSLASGRRVFGCCDGGLALSGQEGLLERWRLAPAP